jgi:hypothetical protein
LTLLRILPAAFVAAALIVSGACNGDDGPSDEDIEQALQAMVLQPSDVPEGLQSVGGSFADNAQAASGLGGGPTEEQLDAWGRILGYQSDYQNPDPNTASYQIALGSSASLYETDQGASDSFTDRVNRAEGADWQASHSDLAEFQQEELELDVPADDTYWVHLTGFQQTSPTQTRLVSDDIMVFRVGRSWGYLNVVSLAAPEVTDRTFAVPEVQTLATKQVEHMRDVLDSGAVD